MLTTILTLLAIILLVPVLLRMFTTLDTTHRRYVYFSLIAVSALIVVLQHFNAQDDSKRQDLIVAFNQGAELICDTRTVSNKAYEFISGTMTFNARIGSSVEGFSFKVRDCRVKP